MEWDDLLCSVCKELYNDKEKIPYILISCGHTFCYSCLRKVQKDSVKFKLNKEEIL